MSERIPYNETELVRLLAEGSEYAFTQLFNRYQAGVYKIALQFVKSPALAEEVVQETFLKIWEKREALKSVLRFEAYVHTMARNQVFDNFKDVARATVAEQEYAQQRAAGAATDNTDYLVREGQYAHLLQSVISQLPPYQKQVFELAKLEGLSHETIARQLNLSPLSVKTYMKEALRAVRQKLKIHNLFAPFMLVLAAAGSVFGVVQAVDKLLL